MKNRIQTLSCGFVAVGLAGLLGGACGSSEKVEATRATEQVPTPAAENNDHSHTEKRQAPVELTLAPSAQRGLSLLTLTATAMGELPDLTLRLVVPKGVTVVGGDIEKTFGPLTKGTSVVLSATVEIPSSGAYEVAGGAEVVFSAGLKLAKSVVVAVGDAPAKSAPKVVDLPEGGSVRLGK